jgi:serine protease
MKFFSPKSIAVIVLLISGCGGGSGGSSAPAQATPTAIPITSPTVRASITGGTFSTVQTVELTASNGANVFFTTDSTTPNNSSTSYSGPIAISTDTVLSFIAIGSTGQSSQVIRETYLIDTLAPMNHALTSATAVVSTDNQSNFSLSIENGETGSTYRIVIDDADPNTSEIVRTGRIVISFATTIQVDLSNLANGQLFASLVLSDDAGNSSTSFSLELNKTGSLGPFAVTGAARISPGTQIDSDVNDITTTIITNNDFSNAQQIFSPGMLGGYVNQSNTGESGHLEISGDRDFFFLELINSDQIILTIGDDSADLDINLYNNARELVADSIGTGNTEVINVTASGTYFVEVFAFFGASNYVLSVGQRAGLNTAFSDLSRAMSSFDEFVPNQAVFQLAGKALTAEMQTNLNSLKSQGLIMADVAADKPQLMSFGSVKQRDRMINSVNPLLHSQQITSATGNAQKNKQETIWAIKALRQRADISDAQPNFMRGRRVVPNDPLYSEQWHFPHIKLPEAWDITTGSPNVIVAVIDSGILSDHPDFQGKLVAGYDMISDANNARDGDGIDSDPEDTGDLGLGDGSSSFHGTHVAGTVAAATNNNIGVAGVAWQSSIMPIRVLGRQGGTSFDLIQGILYAAGLENASGQVPQQRADIINMSLGGGGFSSSEASAIGAARNAGVIIVAAAGNSDSGNLEYPAAYDGVVSVAAVNQANIRANYSNFGQSIDVTAPGGDLDQDADQDGAPDGVLSTIGNDRGSTTTYGYRFYQGTSMSSPHVAGVAALMKSVDTTLSPAEFDQVLSEGRISDDLGDEGRDNDFGYGLINAMKAVSTARELASGTLTPLPARLQISPSTIDFGLTQVQQAFNLANSGGGTLSISSVTENASWLTITNNSSNANNLGAYTASADRDALTIGSHTANIAIQSTLGASLVGVNIRVSERNFSAQAGTLFALLGDPSTGDTIFQEVLTDPSDGSYTLNFISVPAGEYQLFVGSDMDNDGFICDAGEVCGGYPTLNLTENLRVITNRQLEIDISFDQSRFFNQLNAKSFQGFPYKDKNKAVSKPRAAAKDQ